MMKKSIILLLPIILFACSNKPNLETSVKQYMKDTFSKRLDDPASYEFVSMQIDTFKGKNYIQNLTELYPDDSTMKVKINELKQKPGYADSILNYQIEVNFRNKNLLNAKVLNKIELIYDPYAGKITEQKE